MKPVAPRVIHVIPVPAGMVAESVWQLICAGVKIDAAPARWAVVDVDPITNELIGEIPPDSHLAVVR